MKQVWAPWRIQYILGKKTKGCFLCLRKTRGYRKRHYILAETKHSFVILNKFPYTVGHLMVVPFRHVPDLDQLQSDEMIDFFALLRTAAAVLKQALTPDALNIGANLGKAAGAGAEDHLHFHIVARWNGDHNFLPVISDTMVISEYLDKTYERLLPFFKNIKD
ncbi:MAG: HIT domain-containing protein [Deltaproteobacteria bacterium]|nr:HIT domain-containing protein [Deltaproteobacteria bacterium]